MPALTQPTADIDVIVRMRRRRKIYARFSVINETSHPWSSKALTVCTRPDGELTTTLAVASRTDDSNASIETAESAFTGESSVACIDWFAGTIAEFVFDEEGESMWSIEWCFFWHWRHVNLLLHSETVCFVLKQLKQRLYCLTISRHWLGLFSTNFWHLFIKWRFWQSTQTGSDAARVAVVILSSWFDFEDFTGLSSSSAIENKKPLKLLYVAGGQSPLNLNFHARRVVGSSFWKTQ